jgi:hypothetical protein
MQLKVVSYLVLASLLFSVFIQSSWFRLLTIVLVSELYLFNSHNKYQFLIYYGDSSNNIHTLVYFSHCCIFLHCNCNHPKISIEMIPSFLLSIFYELVYK